MKKIYIHMMMLAAMVVAGATMVSCSKEEVATGKFKMSINATMAGGNSKALSIEGSTLNATWAVGEKVKVYNGATMLGELTAQTDGSSTTLDGTLDGTVAVNDVLTLKFCSPNYTSQDGTLEYIAANCDYATATVTVASVSGGVVRTQESSAAFVNQQAIVKFTLQKSDGTALPANPSAFTVNDGTSDVVTLTSIPAATYTNPNNGDGVLYVALPAVSDKPITLTATVGDDTYTYTTSSNKTFANGQYYEITVGMTKQAPALNLTSPSVGQVIGSDGKNYAAGASLPTGVTKVAMIAYVSGSNGLAIALADEGKLNWATAKSTCEAKTPAFTNGTWHLPSQAEWNQMFSANGGDEERCYGLNTKINTAGGTALLEGGTGYWTSTSNGSNVWYVWLMDGDTDWRSGKVNLAKQVRACLAF